MGSWDQHSSVVVYMPLVGNCRMQGGRTGPFIYPVAVTTQIERALLYIPVLFLNQRSCVPEPVNSSCRKEVGTDINGNEYYSLWAGKQPRRLLNTAKYFLYTLTQCTAMLAMH